MRAGRLIGRRGAVVAGLGLLAVRPAAAALSVPPQRGLAFRLVRFGSVIGEHRVAFSPDDDELTVHIAVDAQVSLFGVPLVRYHHQAVEKWREGRLWSLAAETQKNGKREWMKASRDSGTLVVEGSQTARYAAPAEAIGTSYWNKRMLEGPMISLEDGVLLRPKVALHRDETIRLASGAPLVADHYALSGAFVADVWYDASRTWAGFAVPVADGSTVRYERL
jgi:hypothetical protein